MSGATPSMGTPKERITAGVTIAPHGDILTVNSSDGNMVEITPGGEQIAARAVDGSLQGAGTLFGLTIAPNGQGDTLSGDNTLNLLH